MLNGNRGRRIKNISQKLDTIKIGMKTFKFNTIYIVESLYEDEEKTGRTLYNQLKPLEAKYNSLNIVFCDVHSRQEWDNWMSSILNDCDTNGVFPIIHLEIHGQEEGIGFTNGDFISVDDINKQFRAINLASECNLFITLGVCEGLYVLFGVRINESMPYCGAIGSFDDLWNKDIQLRYADFYETFFQTFNVYEAYKSLMTADTGYDPKYRYIPLDEIFYKCYLDYLQNGCTKDALKQRAIDSMPISKLPLNNRRDKRTFQKKFIMQEKKTRYIEYKKAAETFFAVKLFPENRERFDIPNTFEELKEKCKSLIV